MRHVDVSVRLVRTTHLVCMRHVDVEIPRQVERHLSAPVGGAAHGRVQQHRHQRLAVLLEGRVAKLKLAVVAAVVGRHLRDVPAPDGVFLLCQANSAFFR
eukprot:1176279-Prorocentrum_minimum.AAC.6